MQAFEGHRTCLNTQPHHDIIEDHLLHFLGCIEFHERYDFLNSDDYPVWTSECQYLQQKKLKSEQQAKTQAREQRKRWKLDCESELRRISFLRSRLESDDDDKHLVKCIEESRCYWKGSDMYKTGIESVKRWKDRPRGHNIKRPEFVKANLHQEGYRLERDVNVPIIQFENGEPKQVEDGVIWGTFPDQKIKIERLLHPPDGKKSHLYRGDSDDTQGQPFEKSTKAGDPPSSQIKYFHLPSNNMEWAEEAVARYFNQERPDFNAIRRETHRNEQTETSLILKDSHWRGQLHGDRSNVNSRFMRPFCDAISSDRTRVDHVPKNIVLFMPYMHWETSRNRERFAATIERLVLADEKAKAEESEKSRKDRQAQRSNLVKISPQKRVIDDEKSTSNFRQRTRRTSMNGDAMNANGHHEPPTLAKNVSQLDRAMTWGTQLRNRFGYPKTPFKMDRNRRIEIVRKEDNGVKGTEAKKVGSPLGQYLIDAARLFEGMVNYRDKQLLRDFLVADSPLHPRRTLDQAYYWTLKSTRSRDRDQVVYRATTANSESFHRYNPKKGQFEDHEHMKKDNNGCRDCTDKIKKVSRVIMVDQLWMWILDAKTIITCFPKRYGANKNDASGVHKSIRARVAEGRHQQIKSVFDLALVILEECSNTFFDQSRTSDKQPQVLDAFSEAIGNIMHKQTVAFTNLWTCTKEAQKMYRHGSRSPGVESKVYIPLLDITPEGKLENEIKDILEEIGIMIYIKKTNRDILKQFIGHAIHILDPKGHYGREHSRKITSKNVLASRRSKKSSETEPREDQKDSYDWFKVNSDETLDRFNDRIEQLEELERSGMKVATSVKDLLELKQQQAGVLQAWLSVNQSDEAIKQSRSVMIFTIVTIVFLPLSFMSSIFGMNSIEIGGDGNTMHLHEQFNYMFGLSAIVIVLTLAFSLSDWLRALVWSCYATVTLRFATLTGLYRWKLEINVSSYRLYAWAEKATRKWKDQQKDLVQEARCKRGMEKDSATGGKGPDEPAPRVSINGNVQANGIGTASWQQWWRRKAAGGVSPA